MVNWEAVTAVSTAFTGLVIFFTVLLGRRQIAVTVDQLRQLRQAQQLDATNVIFTELSSPAFLDARRFILDDLPERMKDPKFRREVDMVGRGDENVHKELIVLRLFERIAMYVERDLLDSSLVVLLASGRIVDTWEGLAEVVAAHRRSVGAPIWENFEKLHARALEHITKRHHFDLRVQIEAVQELRSQPKDASTQP